MRKAFRRAAVFFAIVAICLGCWWTWAQITEDDVSPANYARIKDGMTIDEVRVILGRETQIGIYVGEGTYIRWEGRNKTISARIPVAALAVEGKEIVDDNCALRGMRWVGGQVMEQYYRLISINSTATPVTMTVP